MNKEICGIYGKLKDFVILKNWRNFTIISHGFHGVYILII